MLGFLSWCLCTSVDTDLNVVTKVGGSFDQKKTLEELLDCFTRPGKRLKDPRIVSIVLDFDWSIREALRNPAYRAPQQSALPSTSLTSLSPDLQEPFSAGSDHPFGLFMTPNIDELTGERLSSAGHGLPATVQPSVEVKEEQPTWLSRTIDPNQPPMLFDLTSPSRRSESLPDIPNRTKSIPKRQTTPLQPKKQIQPKRKKTAPHLSTDSANHGYGTRHAEARQRGREGQL